MHMRPALNNLNLSRGHGLCPVEQMHRQGYTALQALHLAPQQVKRDDHAPLSRIFCLSCCPLLLLQRLTLLRAANGLAAKLAGF